MQCTILHRTMYVFMKDLVIFSCNVINTVHNKNLLKKFTFFLEKSL